MTAQPTDRARALENLAKARIARRAAESALHNAECVELDAFKEVWPVGLSVRRRVAPENPSHLVLCFQNGTIRGYKYDGFFVNLPNGDVEVWPTEGVEACQ